jgi:uncharacterized protein YdgA (DUF945 family)
MFKRGPIIVIGIIVVALLAAPYAIGMINENSMQHEIERISENGVFRVNLVSFERSWLDSTATIEIGIDSDYLNAIQGGQPDPMVAMMFGGFTLPIVVEISHGPILLNDGFGLGTAYVHAYVAEESQLAMLAQQFLGMPYVLDIRGTTGFGSGFVYEGEVPPIDFATPDFSVDSTGITVAGTWSPEINRFEAELANLSIQSPFVSAIVEAVNVMSDTSRSSPDQFPLGTGGASIGRISVSDPLQGTGAAFTFEDFSASGTMAASPDGDLLAMQAVYRIGAITIPGQFELTDLALGLNLSNIDMEAANELYRLSSTLSQTVDPAAVTAMLMPVAERVLANDPVMSIEPIEFSMSEGDASGSVTVTFNSAAMATGQLTDLEDPAVAMAAINGDIDLTASKALAHRIAAMVLAAQTAALGPLPGPDGEPLSPAEINAMMEAQAPIVFLGLAAQGMLVDSGDTYTTSIRLENGQLTANGQPMPIGF